MTHAEPLVAKDALILALSERLAICAELLGRATERNTARDALLAPVVEFVRRLDMALFSPTPDHAMLSVTTGCSLSPAQGLSVGDLRKLAASVKGKA